MPPTEQLLDDLAAAVLDGAAVDWAAAECSVDAAARPLVEHLRLVASVARVHRAVPPTSESSSRAPHAESAPGRWGHLRLVERVGQGTFGEVFRAWDTRLDREVALKLLPAPQSSDPHAEGSIIQEGRLLAKVRHPNVVAIYGAEQIGDRIGLWMEFVRGQTLEQLLQRGTVFPTADVIRIGIELCRAVSAVHAAGLLHRDIKAQNVTRADDGRVVLMDFGTGRELHDTSSSDVAGTPLYLAPEVLAGQPATVQSDVYSLGVLLYHLATGSYPVCGGTLRDIRQAHEQREHIDIRTVRRNLGPALARVIERACHPEPERRYANVEALTRGLLPLQRRRAIVRLRYGAAAATAVLAVVLLGSEVRSRLGADHQSLGSRLVSLFTGAPGPLRHPVIAVMPFKTLGSEPGSELVVDEVTTGLIRQLAMIDGLRVTPQTSSFMLKGTPLDLADVGKRLGVNLVVQGDARISGRTLVVRAALVPVWGGEPLWDETIERQLGSEGDIGGVVEDLARTMVNRLRLKLGRTERRYDTDIQTLTKYLQARALRDGRGERSRDAIPLFKEVIQRDPSFAPARAALAATYGYLAIDYPVVNSFSIPPSQALPLMEPELRKALDIDPMLAEAHAAMGYMHSLAGRWVDAEKAFRRAMDLDPSVTAVRGDFVLSTLTPWNRLDESIALLEAVLDTDPLSLDLRRSLAHTQVSAGRYDDALENCRRVMKVDPSFPFCWVFRARALVFKGQVDDALAEFNARRRDLSEGWIGYIYAITGRDAEAEMIAARYGHLPQRQAMIYAGLGDHDRAFEALERLATLNLGHAGRYLTYPELAGLRGDPRIETFRRRLGFPR